MRKIITMKKIIIFAGLILFLLFLKTVDCPSSDSYEEEEIIIEEIDTTTPSPAPTVDPMEPSAEDVAAVAKVLYSVAGQAPDVERAALVWCILNRKDSPGFPDTVVDVCEQKSQFNYSEGTPVTAHNKEIASDVLRRYEEEKLGNSSGRVLPSTYLYCTGDGRHLYFTEEFNGSYPWMYEYENPYD